MFNNLIESQSHRREFKRRGRFLLVTTAVYALFFVVAGIASIYAYDARLDAQNDESIISMLVPPVNATVIDHHREIQLPRRSFTPTAPIDSQLKISERTEAVAPPNNPQLVPNTVGIPSVTFGVIQTRSIRMKMSAIKLRQDVSNPT